MNLEEHIHWLKSQCNRHVNGKCTTLACLLRGKWKDGGVERQVDPYSLSTCVPHEIVTVLEHYKFES